MGPRAPGGIGLSGEHTLSPQEQEVRASLWAQTLAAEGLW